MPRRLLLPLLSLAALPLLTADAVASPAACIKGPQQMTRESAQIVVANPRQVTRTHVGDTVYWRATYDVTEVLRGPATKSVTVETSCDDRPVDPRFVGYPSSSCRVGAAHQPPGFTPDGKLALKGEPPILFLSHPGKSGQADRAMVRWVVSDTGYGWCEESMGAWPQTRAETVALLKKLAKGTPIAPSEPVQCMRGPRDYMKVARVVALGEWLVTRTSVAEVAGLPSLVVERTEYKVLERIRGAQGAKTILVERTHRLADGERRPGAGPDGWAVTKPEPGVKQEPVLLWLEGPHQSIKDAAEVLFPIADMRPGEDCDKTVIRADAPDRIAQLKKLAAEIAPQ